MATLKEIADNIGVSITTVSRVLNYDKTLSISDEKRRLIIEEAEKCNYEPPRKRKHTSRAKRNIKIGFINFRTTLEELDDPYYLSIRLGVEKRCHRKNYELVKASKFGNTYDLDGLRNLDGIIATGPFSNADVETFQKYSENIVFIDNHPMEDKYDSVTIDKRKAMHKILDFLIQHGYTQIGYMGGKGYNDEDSTPMGDEREKWFREYMNEKGLYQAAFSYESILSPFNGYHVMKEIVASGKWPQVMVTGNDSVAIGAMKAIHEAGLSIPGDMGIFGFNDISTAQFTHPALSTLKIYTEYMGEAAVDLLMDRLNGRNIVHKIIVPTKLIIRESV